MATVCALALCLTGTARANTSDHNSHEHVAGELIRCPDWQRYAPPVFSADKGQNNKRFLTQTASATSVVAQNTARPAPVKPRQSTDTTSTCAAHRIKNGDTLGGLAARYLGSSSRWRDIVAINPNLNAKRLRIGQEVRLPCEPAFGQPAVGRTIAQTQPAQTAQPSQQSRSERENPNAQQGSLFARLFQTRASQATETGTGRGSLKNPRPDGANNSSTPVSVAARTHPVARTSSVGGKITASPLPDVRPSKSDADKPLPLWIAREGEYFADVIKRWGKEAGYQIVVETNGAWKLGVTLRLRSSFEEAVSELVKGLSHEGRPPAVSIYPNKVLRLGGTI